MVPTLAVIKHFGLRGRSFILKPRSGLNSSVEYFLVAMVSATPVGKEVILVNAHDSMIFEGSSFTIDVAVIWHLVDGKFTEASDISPASTFVKKRGLILRFNYVGRHLHAIQ